MSYRLRTPDVGVQEDGCQPMLKVSTAALEKCRAVTGERRFWWERRNIMKQ